MMTPSEIYRWRDLTSQLQQLRGQVRGLKADKQELLDEINGLCLRSGKTPKQIVASDYWKTKYESTQRELNKARLTIADYRRADKAERICPSPGGCEECPNQAWCTLLRVENALTTVDEEKKWLGDHAQAGKFEFISEWSGT